MGGGGGVDTTTTINFFGGSITTTSLILVSTMLCTMLCSRGAMTGSEVVLHCTLRNLIIVTSVTWGIDRHPRIDFEV